MIFFTIASNNYLPKVRALFFSIRKFHPEWEIHLLLIENKNSSINYDNILG